LNPVSLFYVTEAAKQILDLIDVSKFFQDSIEAVVSLYFDQRSFFKSESLKDPNFMDYYYRWALQVPEKWVDIKK
jgi:hypothetical protein